MATPALTKEEKKAVDAFKQIQATLFPDGDIPSVEQIRANIDSGNFTVRDAFIARMYDTGVPEQTLLAELDDTKEFYNKFEKVFTKSVIGPAPGTLGISGSLNKVNRQGIDFNSSFTQLEKAALDPSTGIKDDFRKTITRPLRTSTDNVLQLKLASRGAAKGTRKLAKGAIPPEVLKSVLDGISDIPDPVTRDAVMASLLGYRGTDLSGIRTSRALATRAGTPRPYYDRETGITRDPDVSAGRGRKGAGPDKPPGPVLRKILDRRFDAAGKTGELFPDHDTAKITAALKKHVFTKIPKDVLDNLLKKPTGYTDLRRITASAIANQLGRPDLASQIISHKGEDVIDVIMTGYYADVEDLSGLQQRGQILSAYEKMMADAVNATDAKGLGEALSLNLPEEFNASYDDIDVSKPLTSPVETTPATAEEIAQGKELRAQKNKEAIAASFAAEQSSLEDAEARLLKRANQSPEIAEAQRKIDERKTGLKKANQVASGEDFIAKALKMAKPLKGPLKVILPPVGYAMAGIAAEQTRSAVTQQAKALGLPSSLASPIGTVAGATEFLPVAPSDVIEVGKSMASPVADPGSARPIERVMADQPELFQNNEPAAPTAQPVPSAPVNIPDPVPTRQGMLAAGGARQRVNQARSAALAGEETSMSGSFLN